MKQKEEIRLLSNRLDKLNHRDKAVLLSDDASLITAHHTEKELLVKEIERLRTELDTVLSHQAKQLLEMPFNRPITKKEQANMGAFKKSLTVKVDIIHPMTALGREMKLKQVTGFSTKAF